MKQRELVCIVCPRGCTLSVTFEGNVVKEVTGQGCKRGAAYAEAECTHPVRTLTSTVRLADGRMLAVKTKDPIGKEKLFAAMKEINTLHPCAPIKAGQVLAEIEGAAIVACADIN